MLENLSKNELASFRDMMQIYNRGDHIIDEGEINNNAMYLLRKGEVGVYKNSNSGTEAISKIKAINFFGEMGFLHDKPRGATIEVHTQKALVYKIEAPNIHAILSNHTWGEMLIRRLTSDLELRNEELVRVQDSARLVAKDLEELIAKYSKLKRSYEQLKSSTLEIFSILSSLYKNIGFSAIINTRDWYYLKALDKVVIRLLETRLPYIKAEVEPAGPDKWTQLFHEGILPEILYSNIKNNE